jgi:two-component system NarL family response regulator
MNDTAPIRILVADDHPVVREGLVSLIERRPDMKVAAQSRNGQETLEMYRLHRPDITLMDVRMPQMDGLETTLAIRTEFPQARIILLSTFDAVEDVYHGLQIGAKAYLLKDTLPEELLQVIQSVHDGQTCVPPELAAKLAERLSHPELTPREQEVLRLMVAGKSNQEIGKTLFIAEGTVKVHVANILGKMHVSDRTQAVTEALKRGIVRL